MIRIQSFSPCRCIVITNADEEKERKCRHGARVSVMFADDIGHIANLKELRLFMDELWVNEDADKKEVKKGGYRKGYRNPYFRR